MPADGVVQRRADGIDLLEPREVAREPAAVGADQVPVERARVHRAQAAVDAGEDAEQGSAHARLIRARVRTAAAPGPQPRRPPRAAVSVAGAEPCVRAALQREAGEPGRRRAGPSRGAAHQGPAPRIRAGKGSRPEGRTGRAGRRSERPEDPGEPAERRPHRLAEIARVGQPVRVRALRRARAGEPVRQRVGHRGAHRAAEPGERNVPPGDELALLLEVEDHELDGHDPVHADRHQQADGLVRLQELVGVDLDDNRGGRVLRREDDRVRRP